MLLLGCQSRVQLSSTYSDASGHRLYLFEDSTYITRAGRLNEMFYRRGGLAFGPFCYRSPDTLVLNSAWPERAMVRIETDTLVTRDFALHLVDRNGVSILRGAGSDLIAISELGDTLITGAVLLVPRSARRPQWVRFVDGAGVVSIDTVWVPETTWLNYRAIVDWSWLDFYPEVLRLNDYKLLRRGTGLHPLALSSRPYGQEPAFLELVPMEPLPKERREMERQAARIRKCGYPETGCH